MPSSVFPYQSFNKMERLNSKIILFFPTRMNRKRKYACLMYFGNNLINSLLTVLKYITFNSINRPDKIDFQNFCNMQKYCI